MTLCDDSFVLTAVLNKRLKETRENYFYFFFDLAASSLVDSSAKEKITMT